MKLKKWLLSLLLSQLSLFASTFTVSTSYELHQALENSALNGENDTIILQPGIYSTTDYNLGTFTFNDTEEYNLTIQGADGSNMNDIVLDGNNTNQVMNLANSKTFTLKIKNLSIINGSTGSNGGGLYTTSNIIVEDSNVSSNSGKYGGGFCSSGTATVLNTTIASNSSSGGGGGFCSSGSATVTNTTIANNSSDFRAGGFYSYSTSTVTNSTIVNNSSGNDNAGGFYSSDATTVINSTINNNSTKGKGGGFYTYTSAGTTTVINSTINNNSSGNGGGGGFYSAGITTVINSTINNNGGGGGFYSHDSTAVSNSTISNNSSSFYSYGATIIDNSTISDNSKGCFFRTDTIAINNNFMNNLTKIEGKGIFINNIFLNDGINFQGDSKLYHNYIDSGNISENDHIVIKKSNLLPVIAGDIQFADDNITLLSSSPAIDAGLNPTDDLFKNAFDEITYTSLLTYLKTDYFQNERIANGRIDIGASEYGATSLNVNKPNISIALSGDQKVYYPVTVNFTVESNNTLSELYIDKGNGYESIATTQKSFNIIFNTQGDYTVKVKAVDNQENSAEISKTITIYNLTTQEAIEYGKTLCQNDPTSCGISISSTQDILNNQKFTDTTPGWKLLGTNKDLNFSDIFVKNANISIIWLYRNGIWQAKAADSATDTILSNHSIPLIQTIENGDGFWVKINK